MEFIAFAIWMAVATSFFIRGHVVLAMISVSIASVFACAYIIIGEIRRHK